MKVIAALVATLALAGCVTNSQVVTTQKLVAVDVPERLFNCPVLAKFPEVVGLTDRQVSQLIVTLYRNNQTCKNSNDSIKKYIQEVKRTVK